MECGMTVTLYQHREHLDNCHEKSEVQSGSQFYSSFDFNEVSLKYM